MKKLFFNYNNFLVKNNFNNDLKEEINQLFHGYFKGNNTISLNFEDFDKEISNLIIKILDKQDFEKKQSQKRNIKDVKYTTVNTSWKSKKFIK